MAQFLISYDLHNRRDYKPLWDRLASSGAVRLLESLWLVSLNSDVATIRRELLEVMDHDDSIAVIELQPGTTWATMRARPGGTEWLTNNIRMYA